MKIIEGNKENGDLDVEFVPFDPSIKRSVKFLQEFVKKLAEGKIKDAVLVFVDEDSNLNNPSYVPLTDSPYCNFHWIISKAAYHMIEETLDEEE